MGSTEQVTEGSRRSMVKRLPRGRRGTRGACRAVIKLPRPPHTRPCRRRSSHVFLLYTLPWHTEQVGGEGIGWGVHRGERRSPQVERAVPSVPARTRQAAHTTQHAPPPAKTHSVQRTAPRRSSPPPTHLVVLNLLLRLAPALVPLLLALPQRHRVRDLGHLEELRWRGRGGAGGGEGGGGEQGSVGGPGLAANSVGQAPLR